ncbi:nuclear fragile X mental retardation-interacting protein 1 [Drosophila ficusphila]|uniref:nuclear fragile X mental retardation-interacting protein 1 n=1 Tax=Drosophila ficusphila TaxID=30025 RepID=UPI001C8A511F|nr:nuclear fragile X mental retardation-interacting protein 1 [Drosophila ficusphila]
MEEKVQPKFVLPSPKFDKPNGANKASHLYLTPSGMTLLPRAKQPPPMYGARGPTVPPKYLIQEQIKSQNSCASVPETPPIYNSPPRSEFCHTCSMELSNSQDMKRHLEQHESCPADNCDFAALHNILERHIEGNHITGAYKKVKKVWTEEELAAWKSERRKRFPTAANVELAKLAKEQRIKRGERLEASKSRFGNREDRQRTRPKADQKDRIEPKNKKRRGAKCKVFEKKNVEKSTDKETDAAINNEANSTPSATAEIKVHPNSEKANLRSSENAKFGGTGQMKDYHHFKAKVKKQDNALFGLLGMYGSDSEDESETEIENQDQEDMQVKTEIENQDQEDMQVKTESEPKEKDEMPTSIVEKHSVSETYQVPQNKPIFNEDSQTSESQTFSIENVNSSDIVPREDYVNETTDSNLRPVAKKEVHYSSDEAPDEVPFQRVTETIRESSPPKEVPKESKPQTAPKRVAPKRVYGLNYKRSRQQTQQNTMLSKLLESDIRHERNVLLQCVRHVCEKNFFGIGQSREEKAVSACDKNNEKLDSNCDKIIDVPPHV